MDIQELIRNLGENVTAKASVKSVFGDPVSVGDRTVIPVASIRYGFGGGGGAGQTSGTQIDSHGGGGGGGAIATPCGMIEVSPQGARFIAFQDNRKLAIALFLGFVVGAAMVGLRGKRRIEIVKKKD